MRATQNTWIRRLVAVLLSSGVLGLGASPAATDPVPVVQVPARVWRVGDRVVRNDRRRVQVRVLPVRVDGRLPEGVRPQSTRGIDVESEEECLEVGPEGARRSTLRVRSARVLEDGVVRFEWKGDVGTLEIAPGTVPNVVRAASLPDPVLDWVRMRFDDASSGGDVVPAVLRGVRADEGVVAGELSREDFLASPAVRATADDARGEWRRVGEIGGCVTLRGTVSATSRGPDAAFLGRASEWVVGGRVHTRLSCSVRPSCRLPESGAIRSSLAVGVVGWEGGPLAIEVQDVTEHVVSCDGRVLLPAHVSREEGRVLPLVVRLRGEHVSAGELKATGVASGERTVLTATHAIAGMRRLRVEAPGQEPISVDAVWVPDPRFDVCLVRLVTPLASAPAKLAWIREPIQSREDLGVLGLGPQGGGVRYPARIASEATLAGSSRLVLTWCQAPPGSSGAPLLDERGRLAGILVQGSPDVAVAVETPSWCFDGGAATGEPRWEPVPAADRPGRVEACALRMDAQVGWAWRTDAPMDWSAVTRVGACLDFDSERAYLFDDWSFERGMAGDWAAAAHGQAVADALQPRLRQVREDSSQLDAWYRARRWVEAAPGEAVERAREACASRPLDGSARVTFALALKQAGSPRWSEPRIFEAANVPTPEECVELLGALVEAGLEGRARVLAEAFEAGTKGGPPWTAWIRLEQRRLGEGPYLSEEAKHDLARLRAHPLLARRAMELEILLALRDGKSTEAARLGKDLDPRRTGREVAASLAYVHAALGSRAEASRWVRLGLEESPWDPTLLEYASRLRDAVETGPDPYAQILEFVKRPATER